MSITRVGEGVGVSGQSQEVNEGLDIRRNQLSRKEICSSGIYFLIKEQNVVYVGQACDILARLFAQHGNTNNAREKTADKFDSFSWINCPENQLNELEAKYIFELKPSLNKTIPSNTRYRGRAWTEAVLKQKHSIDAEDWMFEGLGAVIGSRTFYDSTAVVSRATSKGGIAA